MHDDLFFPCTLVFSQRNIVSLWVSSQTTKVYSGDLKASVERNTSWADPGKYISLRALPLWELPKSYGMRQYCPHIFIIGFHLKLSKLGWHPYATRKKLFSSKILENSEISIV